LLLFSFDDLKAGLAYVKRKSSQQTEGPMSFVKANLSTFMDCYDTLSGVFNAFLLNIFTAYFIPPDMHEKMAEDSSGQGTKSVTQTLEDTLNGNLYNHLRSSPFINFILSSQMLTRLLRPFFMMCWDGKIVQMQPEMPLVCFIVSSSYSTFHAQWIVI
jgi:hypothetical protein